MHGLTDLISMQNEVEIPHITLLQIDYVETSEILNSQKIYFNSVNDFSIPVIPATEPESQ